MARASPPSPHDPKLKSAARERATTHNHQRQDADQINEDVRFASQLRPLLFSSSCTCCAIAWWKKAMDWSPRFIHDNNCANINQQAQAPRPCQRRSRSHRQAQYVQRATTAFKTHTDNCKGKHPGGRGLAGGQHHHRTNMDKYHPGYFGKVGMRYFHRQSKCNTVFTIVIPALTASSEPLLEACHQPRQALVPRPSRAAREVPCKQEVRHRTRPQPPRLRLRKGPRQGPHPRDPTRRSRALLLS